MAWQALLKTAAEYCKHKERHKKCEVCPEYCEHEKRRKECEVCPKYCGHEKKHKDCKVCPNKFRLELLMDIDMLLFEKGIRGGISQAVKSYAKANNKYMSGLYNPDEVSIFLQYIDINEYGWAIDHDLPTHGFKWKNGGGFTAEK